MSSRNGPERAGRMIFGIVLVALGALFFLGQITGIRLVSFTWPFFIIVPGLAFFLGMFLGGKNTAPLAIPGSIITTIGLILLYQNATGHWESWAYIWALIPAAVGVGLILAGTWSGNAEMRADGMRVMTIGLVMFMIGLAFFETLIFGGRRSDDLLRYAGPAALIGLGLLVLLGQALGPGLRRRTAGSGETASEEKPPEAG